MIRVSIDYRDLALIRHAVYQAETRTSDHFIAWWLSVQAHEYLQQRIDARFANEGDDAVGKWAQLRSTTAGIRKRQGFGPYHPINKRTGQLHEWVRSTYTLTKQGSGQLNIPGPTRSNVLKEKLAMAQVGGNVSRAKGSNFVGPSTPAPPRPVLGLSKVDEEALTAMLWKEIMP